MSSKRIIIAIDGFSSSGKSTMARRLAKTIGYRYIDSGAMYRAVTLYAMRKGFINADGSINTESLIQSLPDIHIDFKVSGDGQQTMLNGDVVENEIRSLEVSNHVSPVAAIPEVRHELVKMQRAMGETKGIVMDGRDIGTVVFPNAEMKVFCNATPERRAERRYKELRDKGVDVSYDDVLANVTERDHIDMTRKESPLRRADDAIALDNSAMSIDEQNEWLLNLYDSIVNK
ncbi:MAG: (d)CMP kinase [Bacteroides sp.]|nr:(d)CMP kinase [Bacteroides sp.]